MPRPSGTNISTYNHKLSGILNSSLKDLFTLMKNREDDIQEVYDNQYKSIRTQERKLKEVEDRFQANTKPVILAIDRAWTDAEKILSVPTEKAAADIVLSSMNLILNLDQTTVSKDILETATNPILKDLSALRALVNTIYGKGFSAQFKGTKAHAVIQTANQLEGHMNSASEILEKIVEDYRLRKGTGFGLTYKKELFVSMLESAETAKKELDELLA